VTKAVGILLGSTTVLTAILFYFGWSRAYYFFDYFGVDSSLLGLTTRDYVQLSVDGLFVPLAVVACGALALLWAWTRLSAWAARHRRSGAVTAVVSVAGALLLLNGLSRVVVATPVNSPLAVAPACLAGGAALLVYGLRRHRGATGDLVAAADWAVVFVLVGLSLFWAANDYSAAVGRSRARQFVAQLPTLPDAVLYSEKSLGLKHPGIREIPCVHAKARYGFRYDGLKLVLQSGDEYLFLPETWTPAHGVAVLLPRSDTTRLEFRPAGAAPDRNPTC
jgi:hypothetical protein